MLGSSKRTPTAAAGAGSAGSGSTGAVKAAKNSLRAARRRLSIVSDNKLIEGIATLGTVDAEEARVKAASTCAIRTYAGLSKKGYAPYNPRKRNQDALLMDEHAPTGSFIFGVFDGHGEAGDLVSHYFTERLTSRVVAHPKWITDPGACLIDEVHNLEACLLAGMCGPPQRTANTHLSTTHAYFGGKQAGSNYGWAVVVGDKHAPHGLLSPHSLTPLTHAHVTLPPPALDLLPHCLPPFSERVCVHICCRHVHRHGIQRLHGCGGRAAWQDADRCERG